MTWNMYHIRRFFYFDAATDVVSSDFSDERLSHKYHTHDPKYKVHVKYMQSTCYMLCTLHKELTPDPNISARNSHHKGEIS